MTPQPHISDNHQAQPANAEPLLLTVGAACRFSSLSRTKLYELLAAGTVAARKAGKRTLIETASLRRAIEAMPKAEFKAAIPRRSATSEV